MFHPTLSNWGRIVYAPVIKFCEWLGERHPVTLVKIRYFQRFKKWPDLKNPKDLNEKILYLKLFTDTSEWTRLADKYRVREHVKQRGLEECLIDLIGVWDNVKDIDFDVLPNAFIFKANNGDGKGSNLIVTDKSKLDCETVRRTLDGWLHKKHIGALSAEPQYKGIEPRVIAEALLPIEEGQKSLVDYKIWCFNGKAYYIWTTANRDNDSTEVMTYDREWTPMPEVCVFDNRYREGKLMPKPKNLDDMLQVAEKLTEGFPCVRLDLYNVSGHIYFGEMTFTSFSGMMNFYTPEFLAKCGDLVDLSTVKKLK
jgi:hypothetical protein